MMAGLEGAAFTVAAADILLKTQQEEGRDCQKANCREVENDRLEARLVTGPALMATLAAMQPRPGAAPGPGYGAQPNADPRLTQTAQMRPNGPGREPFGSA
jgi:hypothetical protein